MDEQVKTGGSKKWIWGIVVVILIIIIVTLSFKKGPQNIIKIGYFGPFTGPVAGTSGEDVGNGFKLAHLLQNKVGNNQVEVIYEDDACDPKKAVSAAQKLIDIDKVDILVSGVCSGSTLATAPLAEKNKVILFTQIATSPKITDAGDYVFRISASSVETAISMVDLINKLGYKNIAILFEQTDYTTGLKDAFMADWNKIGDNKISAVDSISSKDSDLKTPLMKINSSKPQAIVLFMNSSVTASLAIKQINELGIKLPVIGNEYFAFKEIVQNPLAEGIYAAQYKYDYNSDILLDFLSKYKKEYKKEPNQDIYASLGFDGYNVLFNAIKLCGSSEPECIKEKLYATRGFKGVTGEINIDKNGDTEREFTVRKIEAGKLIEVK